MQMGFTKGTFSISYESFVPMAWHLEPFLYKKWSEFLLLNQAIVLSCPWPLLRTTAGDCLLLGQNPVCREQRAGCMEQFRKSDPSAS